MSIGGGRDIQGLFIGAVAIRILGESISTERTFLRRMLGVSIATIYLRTYNLLLKWVHIAQY